MSSLWDNLIIQRTRIIQPNFDRKEKKNNENVYSGMYLWGAKVTAQPLDVSGEIRTNDFKQKLMVPERFSVVILAIRLIVGIFYHMIG